MKVATLTVKVNTVEKVIVEKAAKEIGMSLSDYVRYCLLINPPQQERKCND